MKIIKIIRFIAKTIAAVNLGYNAFLKVEPLKLIKIIAPETIAESSHVFSEKQRNMSKSIKTKATARLTKSEHKQRTTNTQGERSPSDFETPNALAQQLPMMYRDCSP